MKRYAPISLVLLRIFIATICTIWLERYIASQGTSSSVSLGLVLLCLTGFVAVFGLYVTMMVSLGYDLRMRFEELRKS